MPGAGSLSRPVCDHDLNPRPVSTISHPPRNENLFQRRHLRADASPAGTCHAFNGVAYFEFLGFSGRPAR
jgi:hypothetical protein